MWPHPFLSTAEAGAGGGTYAAQVATLQFSVEVPFGCPARAAYEYLRDPANRPQWQASLRRVAHVQGRGEVGSSWTDLTWPGVNPRMTVTADEPGLRWVEHGEWRGVRADLELRFADLEGGCVVGADVALTLPRVLGVAAGALRPVMRWGVRADLRTAARRCAG